MSFSEKLKASRSVCGLTQEDIAERLHISRQAVSKWENGINEPDIASIIQLCDILNISLDELLRYDVQFVQKLARKERSYMKLIITVITLGAVILLMCCIISIQVVQQ